MAKKSAKSSAKSAPAGRPADPRRIVVETMMTLAASQPYRSITLGEIAGEAGISLADLRDLFPSKGAILGGLMRMVDREVLGGTAADMADETAHDRVLDVMLRRFDALAPYRDGLRSVWKDLSTSPADLIAFNQAAVNSWRYMLESAAIDTNGHLGALRTQGAVLVFARAFATWLDDEPDMARTMAVLDRELKRGASVLGAADALHRLSAPFRGLMRAACDGRRARSAPAAAPEA
ncbi:MAG TPA: TetR/AcrR family transcriptional regulator [Beijerinckiaceae bacterium]|nr:TetR/AcrR family transcriptional regulator [Beijerinckiaceae bacterium]